METKVSKKEKPFSFDYELSEMSVQNLKLVKRKVGLLTVEGMGYHYADANTPYSVDIDFIKWNGTDIKPVLDVVDCGTLAAIEAAAVRYVETHVFNLQFSMLLSEEPSRSTPTNYITSCVELVSRWVGNAYLHFDEALIYKPSANIMAIQIWGVSASPAGELFMMDAEQEWHRIANDTPIEKQIAESIYQRLLSIAPKHSREVAA